MSLESRDNSVSIVYQEDLQRNKKYIYHTVIEQLNRIGKGAIINN